MCRWIAYSGSSILLDELILKPQHSLIDQSLASREGAETTNGDGFGLGWYGDQPQPGLYKSIEPAWNNRNLTDLAAHIRSPLFLAHIRATTGTPVQRTNCHPFRRGKWLFVHNGLIHEYNRVRRDLAFEVEAAMFADIEGTTDSELMFNLALTFGLEDEPVAALERMTGLVERIRATHGIEHPLVMTLGLSDGRRLFAIRYASDGHSRSLYHSANMEALQQLNPALSRFPGDANVIVSEPLTDMSEAWIEIPESSALVVEAGAITSLPFEPKPP